MISTRNLEFVGVIKVQLNDASEKYICALTENLLPYNFRKKRKNCLIRRVNDCNQEICVLITKLRGTNSIDVRYKVSYSYPAVNKIAAYIQGVPFRKQLATGAFHSIFDSPCEIQYSHVISEKTSEQEVVRLAHEDAQSIGIYFLPLLEKCDTPEKLFAALNEDTNVAKSIVGLGLKEWRQISILLYLGKKDEALKLFDAWIPVAFYGKQALSDEQRAECRYRIDTIDIESIPNDYPLFGRQGNGVIIPVPERK